MNQPGANRPFEFNIDKEWIKIAIFLMIPFLRFVGIILLFRKAKNYFHISGKGTALLIVLAVMLFTGSVGEIIKGISAAIIPLSLIVIAIVAAGAYLGKRGNKLDDYVSCIGDSASYDLDTLMSEMGVTEKRLRKDISALKKKGLIPKSAYIDEGNRMLILRPEGKTRPAYRAKPQPAPESAPETENENAEDRRYSEILAEIRALNVAIEDEEVSRKIDRIEEITANIFHLVRQRPEAEKDIQTFMEYYLPTTLKLLRQYAQLERQHVSGENIASSRQRIESILDKLVSGFERQLDVLFKREAIDITNDVRVLEKMMRMDGLSQ